MRIALLSNVNLDILIQDLGKNNSVFLTEGYGQWINYCLMPDRKLQEFLPEAMYVLLDGNALVAGCENEVSVRKTLVETQQCLNNLAQMYKDSKILVPTLDIKMQQKAGNEKNMSGIWEVEWEELLQRLIEDNVNVYRFELKEMITDYGRNQFYSPKLWYSGSIPYSLKAIKFLAEQINKSIHSLSESRKKVLLLDLDNTLWGGILGEEGALGITLCNSNIGAVYQDTQKAILKLKQKGVLLAIVSKNNMQDVEEVFEKNTQMVLRKQDFVSIHVNWRSKSDNIREIAKELNLGMSSFVFLDDNMLERDEVSAQLPEVEVVDFPEDISLLPQVINEVYQKYFWCWSVTEEDLKKTIQYHAEIQRKEEQKQAISMEDFLFSLQAKIELQIMNKENIKRVAQLLNKSNQFNTCTVRMDEIELKKYGEDPDNKVIVAGIKDRYGDNGIVAILLLHYLKEEVCIDNFVMSCRVMGREFENAIIDAVLKRLETEGIVKVNARYITTVKNKPVEDLWSKLNFEVIEQSDKGKWYQISPVNRLQHSIHEVEWKM